VVDFSFDATLPCKGLYCEVALVADGETDLIGPDAAPDPPAGLVCAMREIEHTTTNELSFNDSAPRF
jgi:hypothetical protein